jgi:hypothetical protein
MYAKNILLIFFSTFMFFSCKPRQEAVINDNHEASEIASIDYLEAPGNNTMVTNSENVVVEIENNNVFRTRGRNTYTEEEYWSVFRDFNFFEYRKAILQRGMELNDFSYFQNSILGRDRLVGNQETDIDYMEVIRDVIHIKNNLSFGNKEIDDYFIEEYNYFDPASPKILSPNEESILLQINSRLNPAREKLDINELGNIIIGIWQKDHYLILSGYRDSLKFTDEIMTIAANEMDVSRRFGHLEGGYEIINNNIIMQPTNYFYTVGGRFIFSDAYGLVMRFIGHERINIDLAPNSLISYPIISLYRISLVSKINCSSTIQTPNYMAILVWAYKAD